MLLLLSASLIINVIEYGLIYYYIEKVNIDKTVKYATRQNFIIY